MNYLYSMLAILGIGVLSLIVGSLINKEPEQSAEYALRDSLVWVIGFIFSFGAEFMLLGYV